MGTDIPSGSHSSNSNPSDKRPSNSQLGHIRLVEREKRLSDQSSGQPENPFSPGGAFPSLSGLSLRRSNNGHSENGSLSSPHKNDITYDEKRRLSEYWSAHKNESQDQPAEMPVMRRPRKKSARTNALERDVTPNTTNQEIKHILNIVQSDARMQRSRKVDYKNETVLIPSSMPAKYPLFKGTNALFSIAEGERQHILRNHSADGDIKTLYDAYNMKNKKKLSFGDFLQNIIVPQILGSDNLKLKLSNQTQHRSGDTTQGDAASSIQFAARVNVAKDEYPVMTVWHANKKECETEKRFFKLHMSTCFVLGEHKTSSFKL